MVTAGAVCAVPDVAHSTRKVGELGIGFGRPDADVAITPGDQKPVGIEKKNLRDLGRTAAAGWAGGGEFVHHCHAGKIPDSCDSVPVTGGQLMALGVKGEPPNGVGVQLNRVQNPPGLNIDDKEASRVGSNGHHATVGRDCGLGTGLDFLAKSKIDHGSGRI